MVTARRARWVTAGVVALVAAPGLLAFVGPDHDDFPLSTFPMFASARPEATLLTGAVHVDDDGTEDRLGPQTISGSAEPLQAKALVDRALAGDPRPLCARLLARTEGGTVLLVEDRVRAVDYYLDRPDSIERVRSIDCHEVVE